MARITVVEGAEAENETESGVDDASSAAATKRAFSAVDGSMFKNAGLDPKRVPGGIGVTRIDPPDGYLGHYPPSTTKEDLKRLVGGYILSLDLKDGLGRVMPGCSEIIVKIDAPPVASAHAKAALAELKGGPAGGLGGDQFARVLDLQRSAIDEIREQNRSGLALLRADQESASKRRQDEAEAQLRRAEHDAKIRADEADAKHKREMDLQRSQQEAQIQREREQRISDEKRHTEMIAMIQSQNAQQTQIVVASMQNKTDPMAVITQLMTLAAPLLPMLTGQGDPAVEITKAVSSSLESMTKMATTDRNPSDDGRKQAQGGKQLAGGQQNVSAKPAVDAGDKKTRILAKVGKLMQSVNAAGMDPEAMLDQAIAHYEGAAQDPGDVEEEEEEEQTPEHADQQSGGSVRRRKKTARVARRADPQPKRTGKPVVERRSAKHGRPAPKGSSRGNSAGGKRKRKV